MRSTMPALLLLSLQGCYYYDGDGEDCEDGSCWGNDWDDTGEWVDDTADTARPDTGDPGDDTNSDPGDTADTCDTGDTAEGPPPLLLKLDPGAADPCTTFIATLIDENGLFDLSGTVSAEFFGPVHVLALLARPDEVILSLAIDADAAAGPADLLIQFTDGTAAFADSALTVGTATLPLPADCICSEPAPEPAL